MPTKVRGLSKAVRDLRLALGETQEQFAERLRAHVMTLSRWERGVRNPAGAGLLNALLMLTNETRIAYGRVTGTDSASLKKCEAVFLKALAAEMGLETAATLRFFAVRPLARGVTEIVDLDRTRAPASPEEETYVRLLLFALRSEKHSRIRKRLVTTLDALSRDLHEMSTGALMYVDSTPEEKAEIQERVRQLAEQGVANKVHGRKP